jgi:putative transposase
MTESPRMLFRTILRLARDLASLMSSALRSRAQRAAENLLLRKQLALYLARQVKPRRADDATRMTLVALSRFVEWCRSSDDCEAGHAYSLASKGMPVVVALEIEGVGPSAIPADLRQGIATMATANRTWGEERIAAELLVKLGIRYHREQ